MVRHQGCSPNKAQVVRQIYQWIDEGDSLSKVAQRLNEQGIPSAGSNRHWKDGRQPRWSSSSVSQLLKNPGYKGFTTASRSKMERKRGQKRQVPLDPSDWVVVDTEGVITPAIVSPVLWERVNVKLSANSGAKTRNQKHFYLLRSRVLCGKCGQSMYPQRYERQPDVYRCRHKLRGRGDCPGVGNEQIEDVESYTWMLVSGMFCDPRRLLPEIRKQITSGQDLALSAERDSVASQINHKDRMARQLMNDLSDLDVSDGVRRGYRLRLNTIESEIEQLEQRQREIEVELQWAGRATTSVRGLPGGATDATFGVRVDGT